MTEFAVPLRLVTPRMRDMPGHPRKVRDAQWLLSGHSKWKGLATYKDGQQDGEYGPLSAQATMMAKWYLGFPVASCDRVFGQVLYEILVGKRKLPAGYLPRRKERLAASSKTVGGHALDFLRQFEGYRETPVNQTIFGRDYGWNRVAWCAIFETYGIKRCGLPRWKYASVEMIYLDAVAGRNRMRIVRTPQYGDLALYRLHGDPWAHTAFFVRWLKTGASFRDFGGNTGPSNISNGGMVLEQTRSLDLVHYFVRVG